MLVYQRVLEGIAGIAMSSGMFISWAWSQTKEQTLRKLLEECLAPCLSYARATKAQKSGVVWNDIFGVETIQKDPVEWS